MLSAAAGVVSDALTYAREAPGLVWLRARKSPAFVSWIHNAEDSQWMRMTTSWAAYGWQVPGFDSFRLHGCNFSRYSAIIDPMPAKVNNGGMLSRLNRTFSCLELAGFCRRPFLPGSHESRRIARPWWYFAARRACQTCYAHAWMCWKESQAIARQACRGDQWPIHWRTQGASDCR